MQWPAGANTPQRPETISLREMLCRFKKQCIYKKHKCAKTHANESQSLFIYIAHLNQPSVDQSAVQAIHIK